MAFPSYPFNVQKFPDDDDLLLNEDDLSRKRVVYCRKEILEQMKCAQWAKEEYLASGLDPDNNANWLHYHLQKCYTPYQDGVACVLSVQDREIQKMKQEAGPEGWKIVKEKFMKDHARAYGENKAKVLWEYRTNMKAIHAKSRQRDGHMFGEGKPPAQGTLRRPQNMQDATGVADFLRSEKDEPKQAHLEVEQMFARAKHRELAEATKQAHKKSWFGWGS